MRLRHKHDLGFVMASAVPAGWLTRALGSPGNVMIRVDETAVDHRKEG